MHSFTSLQDGIVIKFVLIGIHYIYCQMKRQMHNFMEVELRRIVCLSFRQCDPSGTKQKR